ncbi:MAG: hypothetical protein HY349_07305 [Nitrospirae bacterium]|nr:hypothetical protein [Nitrospirota bacterium]
MVRFIGLFVVGSFLLIGCGEDKNVDTCIQEGAATGLISVHISCGDPVSRPIYTWSEGSDTTAANVRVARVDPSESVWELQSNNPGLDVIQSPVTHGISQANTFEPAAGSPEPDLQTDVLYRVTVTRADNSTGYREFLIKP